MYGYLQINTHKRGPSIHQKNYVSFFLNPREGQTNPMGLRPWGQKLYSRFGIHNGRDPRHFCSHLVVLSCIGLLHQRLTPLGELIKFKVFIGLYPRDYVWFTPILHVGPNLSIIGFTVVGSPVNLNEIINEFSHKLISLLFYIRQNGRRHIDLSVILLTTVIWQENL